jgi:hypothetical protein
MGLEDASHGRVVATSFEPLHLQVFGADSVHPPLVSLDHFDVPFAPVLLASGSPADSLFVRIRPKGQPAIRYGIPMLRIPLSMTADSDTVGGFGVDEVTLSLPFPEEFAGDSLEVMLDGDGVSAKPPSLVLHRGASAPAMVTVRSAGLGKRALTARGQPYTKPVRVELYFGPPWSFIISALLGGAAAAVVREVARKGATGPRTRFLVAGLIGAFCGFLVAALFVNGVNVAGISLAVGSSELVVFAIAALGGLGGVEALARAVPSLGHLLSAPAS